MNNLDIYQDIANYSEVLGASSYQHVHLLLDKLLSHLNLARMAMENKNIPEKCKKISKANDIVMYLHDCLSPKDSIFTPKLDPIYAHLEKQLFLANARNDKDILQECITIVSNIKTWWNNVDG